MSIYIYGLWIAAIITNEVEQLLCTLRRLLLATFGMESKTKLYIPYFVRNTDTPDGLEVSKTARDSGATHGHNVGPEQALW